MRRNSTARALALVSVGLVVAGGLGVGVASSAVAVVPAVSAPAAPGIHAKTEVLAYLVGDEPGVVISTPTTGDRRTILAGQTVIDPAISPDAAELAYTAATPAGPAGLYVEPVDESAAPTLLVTLPAADSVAHPHWSPDGTELVYTRIEADASRTEVVVDSTTGAQVFATADAGTDATILADGAGLLSSDARGALLTSFSGATTVIDPVSPGDFDSLPSQSPDGSRVVWINGYGDRQFLSQTLWSTRGFFEQRPLPLSLAKGRVVDSLAWSADASTVFVSTGVRTDGGMTDLQTFKVGVTRGTSKGATGATTGHTISAGAQTRRLKGSQSLYTPVSPTRILDTRTTLGGHHGRVGAGGVVALAVGGRSGVPTTATAVVLDVTIVTPSTTTAVAVDPASSRSANLPALRAVRRENVTRETTVALESSGIVNLVNRSGTIDLAADVVGYYSQEEGYGYTPITPATLMDTTKFRYPFETNLGMLGLRARERAPLSLRYLGYDRIPSSAVAVTVSVVADHPTAATRLAFGASTTTAVDHSASSATTSLSAQPGTRTVAGLIVAVGPEEMISLFNQSGSTDLQIVVTGFFSPESPAAFTVESRGRAADTRSGSGIVPGSLTSTGGRILAVPLNAQAVVVDATLVRATSSAALTVNGAMTAIAPAGRDVMGGTTAMGTPAAPTAIGDAFTFDLNRSRAGHGVAWDVLGYYTE